MFALLPITFSLAALSLITASPIATSNCTLLDHAALKDEDGHKLSFVDNTLTFGGDITAEFYGCEYISSGVIGYRGYVYVPSEDKCLTINADTYPFTVELQACDTTDARTYSNWFRHSTYTTYYIGSPGNQVTNCRSGIYGVQDPPSTGTAKLFCGDEDGVYGLLLQ